MGAYVGDSKAVAVLQKPELGANHLKDFSFWRKLASCPDEWLKPEYKMTAPAKSNRPVVNVTGVAGFAIWRGVYFTKLFSYSNRFNVASDWIRNFFFGRVGLRLCRTLSRFLGDERCNHLSETTHCQPERLFAGVLCFPISNTPSRSCWNRTLL